MPTSILQHSTSPINGATTEFDDGDGAVALAFNAKLQALSSVNSHGSLCIANFLAKVEQGFFKDARRCQLDHSSYGDSSLSLVRPRINYSVQRRANVLFKQSPEHVALKVDKSGDSDDEDSRSPSDAQTPVGILSPCQILLQRSIGDWPLYTILLAAGQCLSATSFQITLLGGTSSQSDFDLYIIGAINIPASIGWYLLHRCAPSVYSLALPWLFFALAFVLVGLPSLSPALAPYTTRHSIMLAAESCYSVASAAGFLFFSVNFGEEAGSANSVWVTRAWVVQGIQQIWISALWYFAFRLQGADPASRTSLLPAWANAVTISAGLISGGVGLLLLYGLPAYYRQVPGSVPNFFTGLFRRQIVVWWMFAEVLRDFWLSATYGRNWAFLWNGQSMLLWAKVIEIFVFFGAVWTVVMLLLRRLVIKHSWLLPVVAIGLCSPRWAQSFWGISGLGIYLPWAGVAGPYVSTGLWLWLGMLDYLQGVGLGLMLLQTLSRVHVLATLFISQVIGAGTVMVARAVVSGYIRPSSLFPKFGISLAGFGEWEFWIPLISQIAIVVGFWKTFYKEQLSKP